MYTSYHGHSGVMLAVATTLIAKLAAETEDPNVRRSLRSSDMFWFS